MLPNLEFRYLDITWTDPDTVLRLECSSDPLEVVEGDNVRRLETTTFRRYQPWLGLRITEPLEHEPYFLLGGADRAALFPVKDPDTQQTWWVHSTGWDREKKRHLSELYRTAGTAQLVAQGQRYDIVVHTANFSVDELEYYLRDFKNELWTLILNDRSALKGRVEQDIPDIYSAELVDCLKDFVDSLENIVKKPGVELKEIQAPMPARSVRPVNRTFMELATKGQSRFLTGRSFKESFNTPDNQHVHYCLCRVSYLVNKLCNVGLAQSKALEYARAGELTRMRELATTSSRIVDQVVFDSEILDVEQELLRENEVINDALTDQSEFFHDVSLRKGNCRVLLGKLFSGSESEYFCNKINGHDYRSVYGAGQNYLIVKLPPSFAKFAKFFVPDKYEFEIKGSYKKYSKYKKSETLEFVNVREVTVVESPLIIERERLLAQRHELVGNRWKVNLRNTDRSEIQNELKTVQARSSLYEDQASRLNDFITRLLPLSKRLATLRDFFRKQAIGLRQTFPNSMAFVQNPNYAMSHMSFRKVMAIQGINATLFDSMTVIEQIGLVNVANLYEKWCLLKILKVLTEIYGFTIQDDWKESLIQGVKSNQFDLVFDLCCNKRKQQVRLTYEKWLDSGKRPDFVLDFTAENFVADSSLRPSVATVNTRLVLDAKFRDGLNDDSLADLVQEMRLGKNYSEDEKNQVFILHPSRKAIRKRTSPLEWGADSDYGQISNHRFGGIYLAPSLEGRSSLDNLQRLIGVVLQATGSYSRVIRDDEELTHNFTCIGCGNHGMDSLKLQISTTGGGNERLELKCTACQLRTIKTLCMLCKTDIYKNGYYWTYHRTRAVQISNVVCPSCNSFL